MCNGICAAIRQHVRQVLAIQGERQPIRPTLNHKANHQRVKLKAKQVADKVEVAAVAADAAASPISDQRSIQVHIWSSSRLTAKN